MAITKEIVVDKCEVLGDYKQLQVRTATRIKEDGVLISETYHRHVVEPGDNLSDEDALVQSIGGLVHTSAVITAWNDYMESIAVPADLAP
tara:strand:+ start:466 stop:735 length:270 start_codon:yes stop_codon:yes gene_type:complete